MSKDMATNSAEVVHSVEDEAYEPQTYNDAFPALETSRDVSTIQSNNAWKSQTGAWKHPSIRTTKCTQVFSVPLEERRFKEMDDRLFGDETEQTKICKDIMARTGVSIEISMAKDQSLTVVVHGKSDAVMKARREVMTRLQTQANSLVSIPKEHHRYILGKNGKKLQELELCTATKITVPRPDDDGEMIKIVGPKEGIDKAKHEIQLISAEQAKLGFERLQILKVFHPFVCGPNNQIIKKLMDETNAKINVPPPSVMKDEIVVSGEKEGVMKCKDTLMNIYEEKRRKCQTVSVEVRKSQHKYIIGPRASGLHEILGATGVSVEVPPSDSSSETITLRGEQEKLGPALTMVYSKANSVVFADVLAPSWLHRYVIGRKGAHIKKISEDFPKVHIEFVENQDKITIEGPPEEVDDAVKALNQYVDDLKSRMTFAEITVDQKFHKHIIGKAGSNITKIKNSTGVSIQIPSDDEKSNVIRIEGNPEGVVSAKEQLMEMATRMENEKSRDIVIEQRFHKTIIGAKGENIREIRDKFNQVQITFPEPGKKSSVVTLRGPKNDVDRCYKYLQHYHTELLESNYQAEVHIFKGFHKNIIGKGGANIKKIRDDTDTKIDLPSENSESDVITITGKRKNVEDAKTQIETMQKELANIKEITVEIPSNLHNAIIGAKGRLIRAIMEECGGVIIRFPPEGSSSNKVTIRGPKDDVENARKQLLAMADEKQLSGFTAEVHAKPQYHKFLIGRGGANIRKVRENSGARIIFPNNNDKDQETISIIGTKEAVAAAQKELEGLIKNLDDIAESDMNVDMKHHRHFVSRRGEVLRQIGEEFGGVTVSFPRSGVKSEKVVIKGPKDCIEGAKSKIREIVKDLDAQVTVDCIIAQKYHRTVMGSGGQNVKNICSKFNVGIKFPDKPNSPEKILNGDSSEDPLANGDSNNHEDDGKPLKADVIVLTGTPENCQAAEEALKALVPIIQEMNVPYDYHRFIIGHKGYDVRKMMQDYDVNISIPPAEENSDTIKVTGPPANVEKAIECIGEKVVQLDSQKEDRALRNFSLELEVNPAYHPKIIGRRGLVISRIRQDHNVNIQFPDRGDEDQSLIKIVGYEKNAEAAKEDILKIVEELDSMVTEQVTLDHRIHPRVIGAKGRGIRKITEDFKVELRFPRAEDPDPDVVIISGPEEGVADCKDHLLNIQEEFLQDVMDQEYLENLQKPSRHDEKTKRRGNQQQPGFMVKDAPWDKAPDTASTDEFPSFGAVNAPKAAHAWGPSRKR
ncbi:hypothetical protein LOTGIDRAFT_231082 [Lottia gigantea]|uniref:K Homology domain-containing protein n=1 Tax=Lottia gigantea TaxID=225164 RepID=V4B099_LOTGI|nr:hypothetical protein LOTGIDRAFT_231082 [Lottia gigantea]ESO99461.1 hypothetical protein LOTGIDRAFT_231082 [Lottia gigantea]